MKRNEITTVEQLAFGDRFYRLADKKKTPLEKIDNGVKKTDYRTYKHFYCPADIADSTMHYSAKSRSFKAINGSTQVVFLRHKNN